MHHGSVTPEIAKGLLALKRRIAAAKIPPSKLDETVNVAVWNIREFGKSPRTPAALVELRDDLSELGQTRAYVSDERIKELFPTENFTRDQFSFQLSDHFPVWVQIKTDIDGERLTQIVQNNRKP